MNARSSFHCLFGCRHPPPPPVQISALLGYCLLRLVVWWAIPPLHGAIIDRICNHCVTPEVFRHQNRWQISSTNMLHVCCTIRIRYRVKDDYDKTNYNGMSFWYFCLVLVTTIVALGSSVTAWYKDDIDALTFLEYWQLHSTHIHMVNNYTVRC